MLQTCRRLLAPQVGRRAVVIGGGVTGTLTALRLLQSGWAVTLLEAHHIGSGSSSRSAAAIRQQFTTPETVLGMRFAVQFYSNFLTEVGGCTPVIRQSGYLFLLDQGLEAARERVKMQHSVGVTDVELLSPQQLTARFPYVSGEHLVGATWCPSDGFLYPDVIYNEAAIRIRSMGATVRQNAEVVRATVENGVVKEVMTADGGRPVEGDLFLDCTNAWSPRLASVLGGSDLPIAPTKRYLWFLRRSAVMPAETLMNMPMVVSPCGAYCRPENAYHLLMGWAHQERPNPNFRFEDQDVVEPAFSHKEGTENMAFVTWGELAKVIPSLWEFDGITATTSGFYAVSPDHNPFLGYDRNLKNVIRLVAFSGHGVMFGPFTALVASALAEAGHDLDEMKVFGHRVSLKAFHLDREFAHSEAMVI
eukprot:RCo052119